MTNPNNDTGRRATTPPSASRPIVWVLDDSPLEAAMARKALAPHYDVEVFNDGSLVIEKVAASQGPAALVLDWRLPGMSGIEVCRFLRSIRDETSLPILMLTVYGHKGDLVEGLAAGANDYLTKPYNPSELAARVATLVRVQTLQASARAAEASVSRLLEGERAARAEAEAANAAKDTFLAMVSHELRTPLNAILGWTRIARSSGVPEAQHARALDTIERNAHSQVKLIEDLLDMGRIVSGTLTIDRRVVDVAAVVRDAVDTLRPAAANKHLDVECSVAPKSAKVIGDVGRLRQVAGNLLANAIKFTPDGGRVRVVVSKEGPAIHLEVSDNGIGIDPSFLPRVFDRFRQGQNGPSRNHGGLGLGLAIVKYIVELHGGHVSAASEGSDRGATFRVTFPAAADDARIDDEATLPKTGEQRSHRLDAVRVLVVDDEQDALDLMQIALSHHGADVTLAGSAAEAFDVLQSGMVDIVVSDVGMPGEDGYMLMRRVRALPAAQGGKTPAIALTAFAHAQDRGAAIAAGFDAYVSKPVDMETLISAVEALLVQSA